MAVATDSDAEGLLWQALGEQLPQAEFRRNATIGLFGVDFLSPKARLIVEVDRGRRPSIRGGRTQFARSLDMAGHRVLHFWDDEVREDIGGVLHEIARNLPALPAGATPTGAEG
jgi:very-short-patch-repair endonuclease